MTKKPPKKKKTAKRLPTKTKLWRIEGTADSTLEPEQVVLVSLHVAAASVEKALDKIDPILHEEARKKGMTRGDYDIHTEETLIGDVYV
jgi:hypothetical protein